MLLDGNNPLSDTASTPRAQRTDSLGAYLDEGATL